MIWRAVGDVYIWYLLVGISANCSNITYRTFRVYSRIACKKEVRRRQNSSSMLCLKQLKGVGGNLKVGKGVIYINEAQIERSVRKSNQETQRSNPRNPGPIEPAMLSRNSLLLVARTEANSFMKVVVP